MRDENVTSGTTYKYRIYTIDAEGSLSCQNDNIRTVEFINNESLALSQNNPNPFSGETKISVFVPDQTPITLEILDIFGRTVKTLADREIIRGNRDFI